MSILHETQKDRDIELAFLLKTTYEHIKSFKIGDQDSIKIYDNKKILENEEAFLSLYEQYNYLNFIGYLKTLMFTSVERRGSILKNVIYNTKNKRCLDFGSGVGTHAIALLENNNKVDILDVKGPLLEFTKKRIVNRGYDVFVFYHNSLLPKNEYDLIICCDVLEHVYDPIKEFDRICLSLKDKGKLFLQVSHKIKPSSGHFAQSINLWKKEGISKLNTLFKNISKDLYIKRT